VPACFGKDCRTDWTEGLNHRSNLALKIIEELTLVPELIPPFPGTFPPIRYFTLVKRMSIKK